MKPFKIAVTVAALFVFVLFINLMQYVSSLRKQNYLLNYNFNQLSQKIAALELQMESGRIVVAENKRFTPARHREDKRVNRGCGSKIKRQDTNSGQGNKGYLLRHGRIQP